MTDHTISVSIRYRYDAIRFLCTNTCIGTKCVVDPGPHEPHSFGSLVSGSVLVKKTYLHALGSGYIRGEIQMIPESVNKK
jgi:hypothetical protein